MKAEIISIGDELLIGQTINSNSSFIADKLTEIGVDVNWITTVGDNENQIFESIETAEKRSDVTIVTGGLGPTHDDITKNVFVKYFQSTLILDEALLRELRQRFKARKIKMVKTNDEQAMVPDNATVIENEVGTAPGLLFEKNNKFFFVLPGVPIEMKTITEDFILPFLKKKNKKVIIKRVLHFSGIPESTLFEKLGDIELLEKQAKIAFLPHFGLIDIRLTASGTDPQTCLKGIKSVEKTIREKVGSKIWGTDDDTIEGIIIDKMLENKKTISIVEYGTRGEIINKLTNNQDSEKYLIQGLVLGSLKSIETLFGQSDLIIEHDDSVSEKKAKYLAQKIKQQNSADIGLAILHNNNVETASFIALSDSNQTLCWKSIFPRKGDFAIKRLVVTTLHHLHYYISKKNLLD
jgi:nicotinamide-nucleotide amidase